MKAGFGSAGPSRFLTFPSPKQGDEKNINIFIII